MHGRAFVDESKLNDGIYERSLPLVYHQEETIDSLISRGKMLKTKTGLQFLGHQYFENLKKCTLVDAVILVEDQKGGNKC